MKILYLPLKQDIDISVRSPTRVCVKSNRYNRCRAACVDVDGEVSFSEKRWRGRSGEGVRGCWPAAAVKLSFIYRVVISPFVG